MQRVARKLVNVWKSLCPASRRSRNIIIMAKMVSRSFCSCSAFIALFTPIANRPTSQGFQTVGDGPIRPIADWLCPTGPTETCRGSPVFHQTDSLSEVAQFVTSTHTLALNHPGRPEQ